MKKVYKMKAETGKFFLSLKSPDEIYVQRSMESVILLSIIYGVILTLIVGIIPLFEDLIWYYQIISIILLAILFFHLCFFGNTIRNKIICLFVRIKEHKEKF